MNRIPVEKVVSAAKHTIRLNRGYFLTGIWALVLLAHAITCSILTHFISGPDPQLVKTHARILFFNMIISFGAIIYDSYLGLLTRGYKDLNERDWVVAYDMANAIPKLLADSTNVKEVDKYSDLAAKIVATNASTIEHYLHKYVKDGIEPADIKVPLYSCVYPSYLQAIIKPERAPVPELYKIFNNATAAKINKFITYYFSSDSLQIETPKLTPKFNEYQKVECNKLINKIGEVRKLAMA